MVKYYSVLLLIFLSSVNFNLIGQVNTYAYERALLDIRPYNHEPYIWSVFKNTDITGSIVYTNGKNETEYSFYLLANDTSKITRAIIQIADSNYITITYDPHFKKNSKGKVEAVILEYFNGEISEIDYGFIKPIAAKNGTDELLILKLKNGKKVVLKNKYQLHLVFITDEDYFLFPEYKFY